MDWLTNIKSFIEIVEQRSFTKAAEKRYSSPAAMSRRVTWLEDQLGLRLIERTTRTLQLTDEGKYFYEKARQLVADLFELTNQLQAQKKILKGPLKITMPYSFSETVIVRKVINDFIQQYPDIELSLDFSNQNRDLITDNIDVAFRAAPYQGNGFQSIKIAELKIGIFAAPKYLKKQGIPKKISDLSQHNCLLHENIGLTTWEFKQSRIQTVQGNIKSNSSRALIELAKCGLGLVRIMECYVLGEMKQKALIPILEKEWPKARDLYLIYKEGSAIPLRIKAFVDHVKSKAFNEYLTFDH